MTIKEELKRYAVGCISGKIVSGKKHVWACKRLIRDFEREETKDFPYRWDEEKAESIIEWFKLLRHSKGILAGRPIELTTWQRFFLCQIYGWRRVDNGKRRFRKSFCEVGRKNAKSQMESGVALYEISVTAVENGELAEGYTAGTKRDQSKIIFNECANMLKGSPLKSRFKITRDKITHVKTGSFLRALSKEDGQKGDGTNPAFLCLDEYHQHQTTEFYDLGLGAQSKEPLLMIITTAGMDLNVPCYTQEYTYCTQLLDPGNDSVLNDEYFADILEADSDDDPGKLETWLKANPIRSSYKEGLEKIKGDYDLAVAIPEKMIAFRTKCLDQWVQAKENGYMDMSKWKSCQIDRLRENWNGAECYVGFDMSAKIDLTSIAFVIPVMEGERVIYYIHSHSFIPNREKLIEHRSKDKAPFDAWEADGFITITDSEIVDQNVVMSYVIQYAEEHGLKIVSLCFDPANAGKLMIDLSKEGYDVEEVYQSVKSLNESTQGFREQVYSGNVRYEKNPVLTFAMGNAAIRQSEGLIKIDKDKARQRIDPVDALLCGFKLAMYHNFGGSAFDVKSWLSQDW